MSSKYLNELFYHESDFSFDKIEPFFFTLEKKNELKLRHIPIGPIEDSFHMALVLSTDSHPPCHPVTSLVTPRPSLLTNNIRDKEPQKNTLFEPNRPDKLFWSIYIHIYEIKEYNSIGHSYGNRALHEKMKISSHIKSNAAEFKSNSNYKVTNVMIQEIQSELVTMNTKTSHIVCLAMAFFYGIEIALCFENNTYMTFGKRLNELPICIIYVKRNSYKLEMRPDISILASMFKHHHYLKPLAPISNYKTEELYHIRQRIGMPEISHKVKKQDLYQSIIEYLVE